MAAKPEGKRVSAGEVEWGDGFCLTYDTSVCMTNDGSQGVRAISGEHSTWYIVYNGFS